MNGATGIDKLQNKMNSQSCKKAGHQYQWVDEQNYNAYPGQPNTVPPDLRAVYGGRYVKHLFCNKCGEYKNVELKSEKSLKQYLKLSQLKS